MREHMARAFPRNGSTIRCEVRMVRVREKGRNHRDSDDWGWDHVVMLKLKTSWREVGAAASEQRANRQRLIAGG